MREGLTAPDSLVDLRGISESAEVTWLDDGSAHIGASARLAHLARDAHLREAFPLLAEACEAVGSEAIRTMGTLGGNLCQRIRCSYFRHGFDCLKRGGDRCSARDGENQYHAIFFDAGSGEGSCAAVHPSDPAIALTALEATVHVSGAAGTRDVAIADFFTGARSGIHGETVVAPDEIVTGVTIPAYSRGGRQRYEKVIPARRLRFRTRVTCGVQACRRRSAPRAGRRGTAPLARDRFHRRGCGVGRAERRRYRNARRAALYDARPLEKNGYKVDMASALLRRGISFLEGR